MTRRMPGNALARIIWAVWEKLRRPLFNRRYDWLVSITTAAEIVPDQLLPRRCNVGVYSARIHSGRKATLPSKAASISANVSSFSLGIRARMGR